MTLIPLKYPPGICKVDSPYASQGRYDDGDKIRFVAGKPEKIGGMTSFTGSATVLDAPYIGLRAWADNSQNSYLGAGSTSHLYAYSSNGSVQTNITPFRTITSSTLTNPLDTVSGSATVSVNHTSHGLTTGDYVQLLTGTAVGGVQPVGIFIVTVVNANKYTIVNSSAATSSINGGGGTVTYSYYRVTLSSAPFATTSGSPTVTVTHNAHGALAGDYVIFSGATAVAGLTINGEYQIVTASTNTYTINAGSNANATTTGGGTAVTARYEIQIKNGTNGDVNVWALHHYGQQLLAAPCNFGNDKVVLASSVYIYDPSSSSTYAYPMYNAPTSVFWMFVTPERFVFVCGTNSAPMKVQWPDQTDYTAWTPTVSNTANSRTLQEGTYLVGGIAVRDGLSMVFSNIAAYTFTYTGDSFVYTSALAGANCGLISPLAVVNVNGVIYWMGQNDFWMWNGSVQKIPSDDIRDYVFMNIKYSNYGTSPDAIPRACAGSISGKNEIWFCYGAVDDNTSINTRYVIYHIDQNCWSIGSMLSAGGGIQCMIDKSIFPNPMLGNTSDIYLMEDGTTINADTDDSYVTFGPLDISNGDANTEVLGFIPDFERQTGTVNLILYNQEYPNDALNTLGTYALSTNTGRLDLRSGAKLISGKLENSTSGGDWRLGQPRMEVQPGGARR